MSQDFFSGCIPERLNILIFFFSLSDAFINLERFLQNKFLSTPGDVCIFFSNKALRWFGTKKKVTKNLLSLICNLEPQCCTKNLQHSFSGLYKDRSY